MVEFDAVDGAQIRAVAVTTDLKANHAQQTCARVCRVLRSRDREEVWGDRSSGEDHSRV